MDGVTRPEDTPLLLQLTSIIDDFDKGTKISADAIASLLGNRELTIKEGADETRDATTAAVATGSTTGAGVNMSTMVPPLTSPIIPASTTSQHASAIASDGSKEKSDAGGDEPLSCWDMFCDFVWNYIVRYPQDTVVWGEMLRKIVSEVNSLGMQITKDEWRKCRDTLELLQSLNRYIVGTGGRACGLGGHHIAGDVDDLLPSISTISASSSAIRGGGPNGGGATSNHHQRGGDGGTVVPLSLSSSAEGINNTNNKGKRKRKMKLRSSSIRSLGGSKTTGDRKHMRTVPILPPYSLLVEVCIYQRYILV